MHYTENTNLTKLYKLSLSLSFVMLELQAVSTFSPRNSFWCSNTGQTACLWSTCQLTAATSYKPDSKLNWLHDNYQIIHNKMTLIYYFNWICGIPLRTVDTVTSMWYNTMAYLPSSSSACMIFRFIEAEQASCASCKRDAELPRIRGYWKYKDQ